MIIPVGMFTVPVLKHLLTHGPRDCELLVGCPRGWRQGVGCYADVWGHLSIPCTLQNLVRILWREGFPWLRPIKQSSTTLFLIG